MMRNGNIVWGAILVLGGGLLLAQNLGLIPPGVNMWNVFWALALVAWGVWLLLRSNNRTSAVMPPSDGTRATIEGRPVDPRAQAYRLPLEGARQARIHIQHGGGQLRIDNNSAPDELLSGTFSGGVDPQVRRGTEEVEVDLRPAQGAFPNALGFADRGGLEWNLGLNPNIPLRLDLEVGASRNFINLRDLQVKDLRLQTGASESEIDLPNRAGEMRAEIHSGMASVIIRIPENVSAHIRARGGMSSLSVDAARFPRMDGGGGLMSGGGEYRSVDYEVSGNRVDLTIEAGMGSVRIL